jgi:hypothetical protein
MSETGEIDLIDRSADMPHGSAIEAIGELSPTKLIERDKWKDLGLFLVHDTVERMKGI